MGTYNGATYLPDQLQSLRAQTHTNWHLWASDDGSTDATRAVLSQWSDRAPMTVLAGPQQGIALNYLSLIHHPDLPDHGPVALCDQDDIWLPHRLSRALTQLADCADTPALYCSRTLLITDRGGAIGPSPHLRRPPGFRTALAHNIVAGNTVVLNAPALRLLRRAGLPMMASHHDWWLYLFLTGAGARVIHDPQPGLLYRQHYKNAVGAHLGMRAHVKRLRQLFDGTYRDWHRRNIGELIQRRAFLTMENRAVLDSLHSLHPRGGPARSNLLRRLGVVRQDRFSTAIFHCAAAFGQI